MDRRQHSTRMERPWRLVGLRERSASGWLAMSRTAHGRFATATGPCVLIARSISGRGKGRRTSATGGSAVRTRPASIGGRRSAPPPHGPSAGPVGVGAGPWVAGSASAAWAAMGRSRRCGRRETLPTRAGGPTRPSSVTWAGPKRCGRPDRQSRRRGLTPRAIAPSGGGRARASNRTKALQPSPWGVSGSARGCGWRRPGWRGPRQRGGVSAPGPVRGPRVGPSPLGGGWQTNRRRACRRGPRRVRTRPTALATTPCGVLGPRRCWSWPGVPRARGGGKCEGGAPAHAGCWRSAGPARPLRRPLPPHRSRPTRPACRPPRRGGARGRCRRPWGWRANGPRAGRQGCGGAGRSRGRGRGGRGRARGRRGRAGHSPR
jgi:hypothetical protein